MNITLASDGVHLQTDSSVNKVMIQQGTNNTLTFAENTGNATFLTPFIHPTPPTSANDTQSATTEYVRTYIQTLNLVDSPITDQSSAIFGIKASTIPFDCTLLSYNVALATTDIYFTAIYLTAGMQFTRYNFVAFTTTGVPLRFALFGPDYNYVTNSDTVSYNSSTASGLGLLTSTLSTAVNITTTGIYYIFYQANTAVTSNRYYAGGVNAAATGFQSNRITNSWRTSGTLSPNGPFRSFYITGAPANQVPSTFGNIGSKTINTWLGAITFIFLT